MIEIVGIFTSFMLAAVGLTIMHVAVRDDGIERRIQRGIERWCDRFSSKTTNNRNL